MRRGHLVAACAIVLAGVVFTAWNYSLRRPEKQLPYYDHFASDGLKGWQNLGGEWFAKTGTVMNDSDERGAKLLFGSDSWSDYILSADVQVLGPDGDAGLILRSTEEQLGSNAYSGYYAGLRTHDGRLVLGRANYGWLESQTTPFPHGIKTQHWYHLQIAAVGCVVAAVATDAETGARSTVSMQGEPCVQRGRIGLRSYATGGRWRSLTVSSANGATLAALHATKQPRELAGFYGPWLHPAPVAESARRSLAPLPYSPALLRSIGSLRYASSVNPAPVTIRGSVVLRRPLLFVQDATGGIAIPGQDAIRFALGDEIEATGTPVLGSFSLELAGAAVHVLSAGKLLPPKSVTASDAATGTYDAQYVEVTGLLDKCDTDHSPLELTIVSGSQSFQAELPETANGTPPLHLPRNALVRVRGVEAVDPRWTSNRTPFILFVPSADDVELLANPPWWSLQNMVWFGPIGFIVLLLMQLLRVHLRHLRARAAADERERLGGELHDTLAQGFAGVGYQLQAVRTSMATGSPMVVEHIDLAIEMVRHSHQEARRSIASMQPEVLDGGLLAAMLEERARHMVKGTPLHILANTTGEPRKPSPRVADALFRVGQEAIANAIRHASPATLQISVAFQARAVQLVIEDDGTGFDPAADLPGFGLRSMHKRAEAIGAKLVITSRPGGGARVALLASLQAETKYLHPKQKERQARTR